MSLKPTVTTSVPADNQPSRVVRVLRVLCRVASVAEVIVVDDGSTDTTLAEVQTIARQDPPMRGRRQAKPHLPAPARLALIVLLLTMASSLAYDRLQASPPVRPRDLPRLSLAGSERMLVVAPHPDDETLGAGGLIQQAAAAGLDVRVVFLTNGDGQLVAPMILNGQIRPGPQDYVQAGEARQVEALGAVQVLGVPADAVTFLGYPDGGLTGLWRDDWTSSCPARARFTQATASPYAQTYSPSARYCGRDVVDDLRTIVAGFAPDMIVLPHPQDEHADHRTTAAFVRLAVATVQQAHSDYRPALWGYLIHYGHYPQPRGWHPSRGLVPPLALMRADSEWVRLDLSEDNLRAKTAALHAHASQVRLLGAFLPSFARANELFDAVPVVDAPDLALLGATDLGPLEWHVIAEPGRESMRRWVLGGADLIELRVARLGDHVWLTAVTRGALIPGARYQFWVKSPDGLTRRYSWPQDLTRTGRGSVTAELDLETLGYPALLVFSAEVLQGARADQTAWHLLALQPPAPGP